MNPKIIRGTVASQMEAASRAVVAQVLRDMAHDLLCASLGLGKFGRNMLHAPTDGDDVTTATQRLVAIAERLDSIGGELATVADTFAAKPRKPQRRHVA